MKGVISGVRWPRQIPVALGVLLLYIGISLFFFGVPVVRAPGRVIVGSGDDPSLFIWMLAWWPHAVGHGLDPILTRALFSPDGFNLAWTTAIPGPSLLLAPVTLVAGPVVAYNLLGLLAPALSAFTAFLLCRHVSGRLWPSVVGGYVFGFSSFVLGALAGGHLHLSLVALIPLCVLLVVRRVEGTLGPRRFVALLAACLVGQFLIAGELLALTAMFGAVALAVAAASSALRKRIAPTIGLIGVAFAAMGVVVSPLLYAALFEPATTPHAYPGVYAADLANFVVPTSLTGPGHAWFASLAMRFSGNVAEQGAYLGLPLLAVVGLFAARRAKSSAEWALVLVFALAAILSLGTRLHVGGGLARPPMPWDVVADLPLLRYALPARALAFVFLTAAVMVTLWLSRRPSLLRWLLVLVGVAVILPNRGFWRYHDGYAPPRFITARFYRGSLSPRDRVLILPSHRGGRPMRWQAQAGLRFALVQGYANHLPDAFTRWAIVTSLRSNRLNPGARSQMRRFLLAKAVTVVLVDDRHPGPWPRLLASLRLAPRKTAGVLLYRLDPAWARRSRSTGRAGSAATGWPRRARPPRHQ